MRKSNWLTTVAVVATLAASFGAIGTAFAKTNVAAKPAANSCAQPPDFAALGRDPTDAEVALYGLPPRPPVNSSRYKAWKENLAHAKHHVCASAASGGDFNAPNYNGWSEDTSANWGGWSANTSGTTVNEASALWYVPCIADNLHWNARSSAWVGLGGWQDQLLQVGTETNEDSRGNDYYQAFYEDTSNAHPQTSQAIQNFSISCNDHMYGDVWYPTNWSISDWTRNTYASGTDSSMPPAALTDWACEAEFPSGAPQLAPFGSVSFTSCDGDNTGTGTWWSIANTNTPAHSTCYYNGSKSNDELIYANMLDSSGDSFTAQWLNYQ